MVSQLINADYGRQWGISFSIGVGAWFLGVSFAKFLPPPIQILFFTVPIAAFGYCVYVLPFWQRQGRARELADRISDQEATNLIMRQHHLTIAAQNIDFDLAMQGLQELYPIPTENPPNPAPAAIPPAPPRNLQQDITQAAGAIGWEFYQYCTDRAANLTDPTGYIQIARVRSSWGRNRNLKTDDLRSLIQSFVNLGLSEWRDGRRQEFSPLGKSVGN